MFLARTNLLKHNFQPLQTPKMSKKVDILSQNLVSAWYFMVFLVRTSFPAADTLTASSAVACRDPGPADEQVQKTGGAPPAPAVSVLAAGNEVLARKTMKYQAKTRTWLEISVFFDIFEVSRAEK